MNHGYLLYPVAGAFVLAASLPILASGAFHEPAPHAPIPSAARPGSVVVVTTQSAPSEPVIPADTRVAPPNPPRDDRWWRAQLARVMTTTSVVTIPPLPLAVAPAPPTVQEQAETVGKSIGPPPSRSTDRRLSGGVPASIRRWEPLILKAARKHEVDPNLVAALMQTESNGNPKAVSSANAIGLMQVLDGPFDPEANIDEGARMLAGHLRRFGSIELALAAYNAGPGNVQKYGGAPPFEETHNHIARTVSSYMVWKTL